MDRLQCAGCVMPDFGHCWLPRRPHQTLEEELRTVLMKEDRLRVTLMQVSLALVLRSSQPKRLEFLASSMHCCNHLPLQPSCWVAD